MGYFLEDTCQPIKASSNLHVHYANKHLYLGSIAQFSCSPGYKLQNKRLLICLDRGRWSHSPPVCEGFSY